LMYNFMNSFLSAALASLFLLGAASPLTARQTLIPAGAEWKYWLRASELPSGWAAPELNDERWVTGRAELGYGDGDETTVVAPIGGEPLGSAAIYFRKSFTVNDPSIIRGLMLRLLRDDGAVIFLNGVEIHRDNMPAGPVLATTMATAAVSGTAEKNFQSTTMTATGLVRGTNTLAVEIHQASENSSDLSFDLELIGLETATVTRGPYLQQGTPESVVLRWRTDLPTIGRVTYGTTEGDLSRSVEEEETTTDHELALTGLRPNTQYFYAVGTPSGDLASGDDFAFFTAPLAGTVQPVRLWVLGDSGTKNANAAAVSTAYEKFNGRARTDLWLMLGDNAYDTGTDAEYQAAVFDMYPAMLRQSVLWPTIGNHDTAQSTNPSPTLPYFQMFTLPTRAEAGGVPSGTEKYYSFDYANIHFVCLDSMTSGRAADGAMATWLQNDLSSTNQPWIIAFWHHPPYTKGSHDSDKELELIEMREKFLPLLEAGGVDLVMTGHSHSYERSYLLNGHYGASTTLTPEMKIDSGTGSATGGGAYRKPGDNAPFKGAVYITAGSSGQISGGPLNHPAMCVSLNNLGSMVLDVNGPRLEARFLRENATVVDSFVIEKVQPTQ
jgi:hypothetical protein